ncbi:MAG: PIN domain-containing protein [Pseudomonadota bacterium]|nr:PIN domain-containing protein [Pseudomonadota bacterium]
MRIFLDANVIFSAAKSDGAVRELLSRLHAGGHGLCADGYVIAEARRNLAAKDAAALTALETLLPRLETSPFQATQLPADAFDLLPDKDRPVLAAAIRLGCDALVTGDRTHFGALYGKTIAGVTIHSPRSLAEALLIQERAAKQP